MDPINIGLAIVLAFLIGVALVAALVAVAAMDKNLAKNADD